MSAKPTVENLDIDMAALVWRRSGTGRGAVEIAIARTPASAAEWVLMRLAGDPDGRILVYDRNEWECFLDGVKSGEFDDAGG